MLSSTTELLWGWANWTGRLPEQPGLCTELEEVEVHGEPPSKPQDGIVFGEGSERRGAPATRGPLAEARWHRSSLRTHRHMCREWEFHTARHRWPNLP